MKKIELSKIYKLKENSKTVPVFFACDDGYIKYLIVCLKSLITHTSSEHEYKIYILHTNVSEKNQRNVHTLEKQNVTIEFCDVSAEIEKVKKRLVIRDYYSMTTYYRIFISELFKQYDKVLYLDSDIIVNKDVAELYRYNLGENYVGAVSDYAVTQNSLFGEYVENVLDISRMAYFNAGVLIINAKQFRHINMYKKFLELLNTYAFVVAQDQDYLNILCRNNVLWIDSKWNVQMSEPTERALSNIGIIHYNFARKPWNSTEGRYVDVFWKYASKTDVFYELSTERDAYSEKDIAREMASGEHLMELAKQEIDSADNYFKRFVGTHENKLTRQEIVEKIAQYEREGRFDEDVEDDPPSRTLMPDEIEYLDNSIKKRLTRRYAFKIATWFVKMLIKSKQLVIKDIKGIDNYKSLTSGAVITCNHFNAFDSFAMHITYQKSKQYKRKLYRIIKEGNYTSFPGFFGFLMRNCNTIPLSSNSDTMKKMLKAVDKLLQNGHFLLIYPEQSMWWNYRKPKPLKRGGYIFAVRNNVPVLPCFITMEDTDTPGEDGFPVQAYTVHVGEPIYPDPNKSKNENVRDMMKKNAEVWKNIYEETYGIPLTYTTEK